jgi:hypothetical protein
MIAECRALSQESRRLVPYAVMNPVVQAYGLGRLEREHFLVIIELDPIAGLQFRFCLAESPEAAPVSPEPDGPLIHGVLYAAFGKTGPGSQEIAGREILFSADGFSED